MAELPSSHLLQLGVWLVAWVGTKP